MRGKVNLDARRFEINLLNDSLEINSHLGSVPLHVSVRFDEGKIVLNTMKVKIIDKFNKRYLVF